MSNLIEKIEATEIKDSRGNPTLVVRVYSGAYFGEFSVPSGASTGLHEAYELRDKDGHMGLAIRQIDEIITPALLGHKLDDQRGMDDLLVKLDGTKNKKHLGGNALLGVSVAYAKLTAKTHAVPIYEYLRKISPLKDCRLTPYLFINVINGGKHAQNKLAFQEYHVVPDTSDVKEAVSIGLQIQNSLADKLKSKNIEYTIGDEGGLAPKMAQVEEPLILIKEVLAELGLNHKVRIALDVASSSFYKDGIYTIDQKSYTKEQLLDLYKKIIPEFNIFSIEDPFMEEDFDGFKNLRNVFPDLHVVGDDLTVTNSERLKQAIRQGSINTIIIKPNQIGTVSEMLSTMELAVKQNIKLIISHRSGETMDDFIADVAYAYGAFGLKSGSPFAKERQAKYDRLIEIVKH